MYESEVPLPALASVALAGLGVTAVVHAQAPQSKAAADKAAADAKAVADKKAAAEKLVADRKAAAEKAAITRNQPNVSFFLTSAGLGKGADLGGLAGADAHCNALAKAAGAKRTNWKAYLSAMPTKDKDNKDVAGVNARERIGKGPWVNAAGRHSRLATCPTCIRIGRRITADTALTEKGARVPGRAQAMAKTAANQHDILTGSDPNGRYSTADGDTTCGNWTKSAGDPPANSAIVGHHDRAGLNDFWTSKSWNSSHGSRGCSQDHLKASGGAGQFYCFAAN